MVRTLYLRAVASGLYALVMSPNACSLMVCNSLLVVNMSNTDIYLAYLNYKNHAYMAGLRVQFSYIDYRNSYLRVLDDMKQEG